MKAVILCGGRGTRLGEHGRNVPKALIEIGGKPILWHVLSIFSHYGIDHFVLCLGYLGGEIKAYFSENPTAWNIEFVDTGQDTNTGGRLKLVESLVSDSNEFFVTYGDGLADVNIDDLLTFHREHGLTATVTAVHPFSNFGLMDIAGDGRVERFREKPLLRDWINGGFFIFGQEIFQYLDDTCILEREPFETLSQKHQMMAFQHEGFWKCMDTYKDSLEFEELWNEKAPWKVWSLE